MDMFTQDGIEIFVIENAIDLFMVRPAYIPMIVSDLVELSDSLQNVAIASGLMEKLQGNSDGVPAKELIWVADESLDPEDRFLVVMSKTANDSGGYGYDAHTIREINERGKESRRSLDVTDADKLLETVTQILKSTA